MWCGLAPRGGKAGQVREVGKWGGFGRAARRGSRGSSISHPALIALHAGGGGVVGDRILTRIDEDVVLDPMLAFV